MVEWLLNILNESLRRLKELENMNNKRLHELRSSGAEKIFEAYRWVKEHRNEFNKDVYGPVAIEVCEFDCLLY